MSNMNLIIRYWGRKPRELAQYYIEKYSKHGEIVADLFGGSGVFVQTALELGRRALYVDLNPFAELIAHSLMEGCDLDEYKQAVQTILSRKIVPIKIKGKKVNIEARKLFYVKCICGRETEAKLINFTRIYRSATNAFIQLNDKKYEIFKIIQEKGAITHDELCKLNKDTSTRSLSNAVKWLIRQGIIKENEMPIYAKLVKPCECGRTEIEFSSNNGNIWVIEGPIEPFYWYPKNELKYKDGKPFLKKRDVSHVHEFFIDRSLAILSTFWHDILKIKTKKDVKRCLQLTFMATLIRSSKMCRMSGGTWPINSYWIPRKFIIKNPYVVFENAANQIIKFLKNRRKFNPGSLKDLMNGKVDVTFLIADSRKVRLPKSSVDYVIIDPPHMDDAQFLELSMFYTSWLKRELCFKDELVVNLNQGKTLEKYFEMLNEVARNIYHMLKPNRYLTVILHEENKEILDSCVKAISDANFELVENNQKDNYSIYTFKKK
ncbi:MAG: hypothetical protein LM601_07995 [Candidatus Verstraetearchaeota archaeon]|nr:hypothetical protein [Candidatus Verstraetearchaeota archaeon]